MKALRGLAEDPFSEGSVELKGHRVLYRIRCWGNAYRIVYRVSEKQRKVIVQRIRPRASAYRGLENP